MEKAGQSYLGSERREAPVPDINRNDIVNAASEIKEEMNDDLDELHLSGKTLLANKAAQKASV
jgi:hypothetical protein